jgi:hypothetical protein
VRGGAQKMADEAFRRLFMTAEIGDVKLGLTSSTVQIVLVQIADSAGNDMESYLQTVWSVSQKAGGFLISQMSSLVLITFGLNMDNYRLINLRAICDDIFAAIGKQNSKILYGECQADHGNLQVMNMLKYVILIKDFNRIVKRISNMPPGSADPL